MVEIVLRAEMAAEIGGVVDGPVAVDVDAGAAVVPVVEGAADGTAGMEAGAGADTKNFRHGFARIFTDKAAT